MTDTVYLHPDDPDHDLVDRLLDLHPPINDEVGARMDTVRAAFKAAGHLVVDLIPRTPDRTIAIRAIHHACMDSIASLACNQEAIP